MTLGIPVPRTWVIRSNALVDHDNEGPATLSRLRQELDDKLDRDRSYAVRSSANVEDTESRSYAGQFRSILNVKGADDLLQAVRDVWASVLREDVKSYATKVADDQNDLWMAVIIQEMALQQISGVAFSLNPVTGVRTPVVEAVKGGGEALVQRGEDTSRYEDGVVDVKDGIPEALLREVANETMRLSDKLGEDLDLEWVYDGKIIWWVQARLVHKVQRRTMYSDRLAKEMLPGQIKPLVWSINIPLVNGAWVRIFHDLTGVRGLDPISLSKSFHYRAYFNMSEVGKVFQHIGLPRESLEMMMSGKRVPFKMGPRMLAIVPRMSLFALDKVNIRHEVGRFIDHAEPYYDSLIREDVEGLSDVELIDRADSLFEFNKNAAYYNILTIIFAMIFDRLAKDRLRKFGIEGDKIAWPSKGRRYLDTYPHRGVEEMRRIYETLDQETKLALLDRGCEGLRNLPDAKQLRSMFKEHIETYGHYSESGNDFTKVPWREDPSVVWKMVMSTDAKGKAKEPRIDVSELELPPMSKWFVLGLCYKAALFSDLREGMSSTYTKGYGIFRRYFLQLGKLLTGRGLISSPDDIFLLYLNEIKTTISSGPHPNLKELVLSRRDELDRYSKVTLPGVIFGEDVPPVQNETSSVLRGVPSSGGYYRGAVKVVHGLSEFEKVQNGDIIVIPFSDVSWSSIFSKAGAVISESGGMLSHSSIVAREYGIPAVVSVKGAMGIPEGSILVVDGYRGEVLVERSP